MASHVLVIGASGSIGQNLIEALVKTNGPQSVIAALHRTPLPDHLASDVICEFGFNIRDEGSIRRLFERHSDKIDSVWNLAAPLSVDTAKDPSSAHDVTVAGMERVLTCMRDCGIKKIYFSDSIGSYGIESPRERATAKWLMENPNHDPQSDYGVQKRQCRELLVRFMEEHEFDARFCIIPGVLHDASIWGGGTTEYALDAMLCAAKGEHYVCPVGEDIPLPMVHSEDLIKGMLALMTAPSDAFLPNCRGVALAGFSFTPKELFDELSRHFPDFSYSFDPEHNPQANAFAVSWPDTLCSDEAERHINYRAQKSFQDTVHDIIRAHKQRLGKGEE